MIKITSKILLKENELKFSFITSPGPGGQKVNKVSTAVQLRFNVLLTTSLPEAIRERLINILNKKLSSKGELIIKASRYRTQNQNKIDAINRLKTIIVQATHVPKERKKTKPSLATKQRRAQTKQLQGKKKTLRRKPFSEN